MFDLSGRVAIVSGGTGWLGKQMVVALLEAGAEVHVVARDPQKAELTFSDPVPKLNFVAGNVAEPSWPEAIAGVYERTGRIDVLVNNAHIGRGGSLRTSTHENYREAFDLAVIGVANGMEAAREGMRASVTLGHSPSIINVSSMYGLVAPDLKVYASEEGRNPPFYGAAKAAMAQLTRYAAAEYGPEGIRVNAIAPGPFPAEAAQQDTAFMSELANRTMLGRIGRPDEISSTILYLASPASSFVTGAVIPIDGGWTAR